MKEKEKKQRKSGKYRKNTRKIQRWRDGKKPKKWGREEKKTPDIGGETQNTMEIGRIFSGNGGWKTVGNGTGRNNEIRPGPLTWTTRENIGKSRFAAKNI